MNACFPNRAGMVVGGVYAGVGIGLMVVCATPDMPSCGPHPEGTRVTADRGFRALCPRGYGYTLP